MHQLSCLVCTLTRYELLKSASE
uniref:Uncharacterized protein n=1 Tax=Anguilla anguilla TaxID=7936 RepID=A0A0E9VJZ5_ANGAN